MCWLRRVGELTYIGIAGEPSNGGEPSRTSAETSSTAPESPPRGREAAGAPVTRATKALTPVQHDKLPLRPAQCTLSIIPVRLEIFILIDANRPGWAQRPARGRQTEGGPEWRRGCLGAEVCHEDSKFSRYLLCNCSPRHRENFVFL